VGERRGVDLESREFTMEECTYILTVLQYAVVCNVGPRESTAREQFTSVSNAGCIVVLKMALRNMYRKCRSSRTIECHHVVVAQVH